MPTGRRATTTAQRGGERLRRNVFFLAAARTTAAGRRQPKKTHSPTTRKLSRTKIPVSAPKAKARIYAVFPPVLVRRCSGVGGDDESRLSVRRRRRRKMVGQEFIATALRAKIIRRRIFPVRLRVKHTAENNRRKGRARTAGDHIARSCSTHRRELIHQRQQSVHRPRESRPRPKRRRRGWRRRGGGGRYGEQSFFRGVVGGGWRRLVISPKMKPTDDKHRPRARL